MMINFSNISFGKQVVGKFNVEKTDKNGKVKKLPVQVYRLDPEDYDDCFQYEKIKKVNMHNFFDMLDPEEYQHSDYIVQDKKKDKILGLARCKNLDESSIDLQVIGTSKNKKYKGLGRALLAGILQDVKGKCSDFTVSFALPDALGFYERCYFDDDTRNSFSLKLNKEYFDDVISDAKKL